MQNKEGRETCQLFTFCHFCFHPYRAWIPLGLEANDSTVRRGRMGEIPVYRWSCIDIRCGRSAGVMTYRHAENRSHITFCKSLQCDFPSLVFSEHKLGRKRALMSTNHNTGERGALSKALEFVTHSKPHSLVCFLEQQPCNLTS